MKPPYASRFFLNVVGVNGLVPTIRFGFMFSSGMNTLKIQGGTSEEEQQRRQFFQSAAAAAAAGDGGGGGGGGGEGAIRASFPYIIVPGGSDGGYNWSAREVARAYMHITLQP